MREGLARDCTGGMEMKEWGGCERGDGRAGGRWGSSARRGRGANSRPCFTNCHLKGTNRGTVVAGEKGVQGPGAGLCRDVLTLPPLRHGCAGQRTKKTKTKQAESVSTQARVQTNAARWEHRRLRRRSTRPRNQPCFSCLPRLTRVCAGRRGKQPRRVLCTSRSSPDVTATQTQKQRLNLIPQKRGRKKSKQQRMEKKKKRSRADQTTIQRMFLSFLLRRRPNRISVEDRSIK